MAAPVNFGLWPDNMTLLPIQFGANVPHNVLWCLFTSSPVVTAWMDTICGAIAKTVFERVCKQFSIFR